MQDGKILDKLPEIKSTNQSLIERAEVLAMAIKDEPSFKEAGGFLVEIDRRSKWWDDLVSPAVETAYKAHKAICQVRDEIASPLRQAKKLVSNAMGAWEFRERQRKTQEAWDQSQATRKMQEDAAIAQAQQLEEAGHADLADAVISQPISTPVFTPSVAKADGVSFRSTWSAEVVSLRELIEGIVSGRVPMAAVKADQVFLNRQASTLKNELKYPGVKVNENRIAAVRS